MADTPSGSGITAYDLGQWRLERLRALPGLEARSEDRVLRLVDQLQTSRDLIERQAMELARLQSQARLAERTRWRLFEEVQQLRKAAAAIPPAPASPPPPAAPRRTRKAGAR